jgi:hypothetical protein
MAYKQKGIDFGTGTGSSPLNKNGIFKSKKKKAAESAAAAERRKARLKDYDAKHAPNPEKEARERNPDYYAKKEKQDSDYEKYLAEEKARGQLKDE